MKIKKSILSMALIAIVCAFLVIGCDDGTDKPHADPRFLAGDWEYKEEGREFTINANSIGDNYENGGTLTFECSFYMQPGVPAQVKGELYYENFGTGGPNGYVLQNMETTTAADANYDDKYTAGNGFLAYMLDDYQNFIVTLTPGANQKQFTFRTTNTGAEAFFGGTYTKVEE